MKVKLSGLIGRFRTLADSTYRIEIEGQDLVTVPDEVLSKLTKSRGEYVDVEFTFEDDNMTDDIRKTFNE